MSRQRVAARVARRELRRRPATTLLTAALVALPVAAMIVATVILRSLPIPDTVLFQRDLGAAQASLVVPADRAGAITDDLHATSSSVAIAPLAFAGGTLGTPAGSSVWAEVQSADFADPLLRDRLRVAEGHMPTASGEVALSTTIADAWDAGVGDTVRFDELDTEAVVVGVADTVGERRGEVFLTSLPALDPTTVRTQLFVGERYGLDAATVDALQPYNHTGTLRFAPGSAPSWGSARALPVGVADQTDENVLWTWLGGALALAVMGVVIAAAFAVGARRQLRVLGLLAANGAPPSTVRATVVWQGVWVGAAGTVLGAALALAALVVAWPAHDVVLDHDPTWWSWSPRDIVPIVLLGVAAATLAAALPARTAGRISVLRALAGRRPLAPVRARVVIGGTLAGGAGLALLALAVVGQRIAPWTSRWTAVAIIGGLAVLAGATTAAPAVVGLAGALGRWAHGSAHLAIRSVDRQRSRSGAVVAGVAAAAALCLGASAAVATDQASDAHRRAAYLPDDVVVTSAWGSLAEPSPSGGQPITVDPAVTPGPTPPAYGPSTAAQRAAIDAALPGAIRIDTPVATAEAPLPEPDARTGFGYVAMAAPATAELVDQLAVPAAARDALDRGETVALGAPDAIGQVSLHGFLGTGFGPAPSAPDLVPVTPFPDAVAYTGLPTVLLPPATADAIGLSAAPPWDARTFSFSPQPITADQQARIGVAAGNRTTGFVLADDVRPAPETDPNLSVAVASGTASDVNVAYAAIIGGTALFTAFVVALGLALAARDSRDERDVLEAVGAPPRLLRRVAGTRAGLLAGLGAALALPTGLLPVWVVARASRPVLAFVVPWPAVLTVVVVIPVAIGLLALAGGAATTRWRPATASRITSD